METPVDSPKTKIVEDKDEKIVTPTTPILTPKQQLFWKEASELIEIMSNKKTINITVTFQTLNSIFLNILNHPTDKKYRKISITNQKFQKRVLESSSAAV